jgi:hypothetical protein
MHTLALAVLWSILTAVAAGAGWLVWGALRAQLAGRPDVQRRLLVGACLWVGLVGLWLVLLAGWLVPVVFLAGCAVAAATLPGWYTRIAGLLARPALPPLERRSYYLADRPEVPLAEVVEAAEAEAKVGLVPCDRGQLHQHRQPPQPPSGFRIDGPVVAQLADGTQVRDRYHPDGKEAHAHLYNRHSGRCYFCPAAAPWWHQAHQRQPRDDPGNGAPVDDDG